MANLTNYICQSNLNTTVDIVSGYPNVWNFIEKRSNVRFIELPKFISTNNKGRIEILKKIFLLGYDRITIDFFLFGTKDELIDILPEAISKAEAKIILTLRGVIFSKRHTTRFWKGEKGIEYLNQIYHKVICFTDPKIININDEYFNNKINIPIKYLGYIKRNITINSSVKKVINHIVIDFGGGFGCDQLILSVLKIIKELSYNFSIIFGEYFNDEYKEKAINLTNKYRHLNILLNKSQDEIDQLSPSIIIGCGGYNTTVNTIFNHMPLIVIPKKSRFRGCDSYKSNKRTLYNRSIGC